MVWDREVKTKWKGAIKEDDDGRSGNTKRCSGQPNLIATWTC